ncbi:MULTISPECIES: winged helix-turn-helix domain-containing protein [Methanobacterium]|jgi:DNA-binding HxlR family transcriptional regulator/ribosomal protein S17E|uniref:Winged helix-turn-helix domain-containing protein n=2 Tax=Methanobacterium veterum TaxID=408577 RepID=A0A9E5A2Y7_9EURY|nr:MULTISPECIES: winged helix-turn-helix domain-containing protein [Methanobacterium]MCZ3372515.1 winged helix-turn-helix domain-containing protein [Methanobacterium veterum]NLJ05285.1 winged helix-turn-helix transcriptional regulator [Exilispira sp.]
MLNEAELYNREMTEIKAKLATMHKDIKNLMENTNQQYLDLVLANSKKDVLNAIMGYVTHDIEKSLEKGMINKCDMRDKCKQIFTELLHDNTGLIADDNVHEDAITQNEAKLSKMREGASYAKCDTCFLEVDDLFEKQVNLMRSLRIYSSNNDKKQCISSICEESLVKDVLEPLSNKQRLQILKSMSNETKTFSSLSELTGLRGGNLLFHLQKLLDNDMILQRHERGDYMLTEKGYKLLVMLSEIDTVLGE